MDSIPRYIVFLLLGLATPSTAQAQETYAPSWYNSSAPYIKIAVVEDGVYRIGGNEIESALSSETSLQNLDPQTVQLFENGREVPIHFISEDGDETFDPDDAFIFVGQRNRGTDEVWAYNNDPSTQSSTFRSLYSDTTTYWMTWGQAEGIRYQSPSPPESIEAVQDLPYSLHLEQDNLYFYGADPGDPRYTTGEGYYWTGFRINQTGTETQRTFTANLEGLATTSSSAIHVKSRFMGTSGSCHRVTVEAELASNGESLSFESIDEIEWNRYTLATSNVTIDTDRIPTSNTLRLRFTAHGDADCGTPNYINLDWIEVQYTRRLTAQNNIQRFTPSEAGAYAFELSGYTSDTVFVLNPQENQYFEGAPANGNFTIKDATDRSATYWAVGPSGLLSPAAVQRDIPSDWAALSNEADYVLLTTRALLPSAQNLATYRRSPSGGNHQVVVVAIEDVFDEFDYGQPTPIAIRRFAQRTHSWAHPPQFLTIWADAQYPVYTKEGVADRSPPWSVPAFGFSPSDGWFAMQAEGADDWAEFMAVGRIPIRTNAQGDIFLEKIQAYESAPLRGWQKRMLMLAGGTSPSEQQSLQFYTNRWAEMATGIPGDTLYSAGMDTLFYFKNVNDPLDTSFQDSLAVDIQRGAGWLNYFGHSAAQTWEIVTDPPSEFDNAGRLPVVVSLGCKTGSFAGGRSSTTSAPSLAEQLVVGTLQGDGDPSDGALNGGIAHWGTSALGNLLPSARLNDDLIEQVFQDTVRTLGIATQRAKANIAADYGQSDLYVRHLLQYSLLGDPATKIAIPDKPDFHLTPDLVSTSPLTPTPGETLNATVRLRNRGLVPSDSVDVTFERELPSGERQKTTRRIPRFPLEQTIPFSFFLDEEAVGTNRFQVRADPANEYAEALETNNATAKQQVVFDTGLEIVTPRPQGIVTSETPTLRFTLASRTGEVPIAIELDSLSSFSSPFLQRDNVTAAGIQLDWQVPVPLQAGKTYYWRARLDEGPENTWKSGSFTVAIGFPTSGWLQQNQLFGQNQQTRIRRENGSWTLNEYGRTVKIISQRRGNVRDLGNYGFNVGGSDNYEYLGFGFGVLVMDGQSGEVIASGSFPPYALPERFRQYTDGLYGDQAVEALHDLLENTAEHGDYIFVRTRHLANPDGPIISEEVKDLFRSMGTNDSNFSSHTEAIDTLTYNHMWTLEARKGFPGATTEQVSPPEEAPQVLEILQEAELTFSYPSGQTVTSRIGPAQKWTNLQWEATLSNNASRIDIDVLSADGTSVLKQFSNSASSSHSLSNIEATSHPFLRLRATLSDSSRQTTPQLDQWSIGYKMTAELAANPAPLQTAPDTLQEGEVLSATIPILNLGEATSSPVHVRYELTDSDNQTTVAATDTLSPIEPGETAESTATIPTVNQSGATLLTATVLQDGPPEPITFNNTLVHNFFVKADQSAPMLDVLVDGRKLRPNPKPVMNLQDPSLPFVSTQPTIEILLADDNPYFPLSDTSLTEVYLDDRLISFASPDLTFEPATEAGTEARILFTPNFAGQDTTHTLRVEAQDASGNELSEPYQTHFRVSTEQVIRDLYPYPNPMNTQTTFAFRIEGGTQRPSDFQLRIYTLSGRLIRTFDGFDVNGGTGLRIGWNKLRWNGRDGDGDRVATGVYLYRVSMNGEDGAFEGDIEKIAVIR